MADECICRLSGDLPVIGGDQLSDRGPGSGSGNYRPTVLAMSKAGALPYKIDVYHTQPHSIYLAVLVDSGIIGLAILLYVLFLPVGIFIHRIFCITPTDRVPIQLQLPTLDLSWLSAISILD